MEKTFLVVIAVGASIGLLWPSGHRVASTAPAAAGAKVVTTVPTADAPPPVPVETKLARAPNGHFYAEGNVNGQPVRLVVDTGATTVALSMADAQRIGVPFSRGAFDVIGSGASMSARPRPNRRQAPRAACSAGWSARSRIIGVIPDLIRDP